MDKKHIFINHTRREICFTVSNAATNIGHYIGLALINYEWQLYDVIEYMVADLNEIEEFKNKGYLYDEYTAVQ